MPDQKDAKAEQLKNQEKIKLSDTIETGDTSAIIEKQKRLEKLIEKDQADLEKYRLPTEKVGEGAGAVGLSVSSNIQRQHQQRLKDIEKIMADDLDKYFLQMDTEKQQEFKTIGEKTAEEINNLLGKAKVNLRKIVGLLRRWLLIIPGVNKFFLEQEAKIKADEISKLTHT